MKWIRFTLHPQYTVSLGEPDNELKNIREVIYNSNEQAARKTGQRKGNAGKRTCWAQRSMHLRHGLQTNRTPCFYTQTTEFTQKIKILNSVQIFIKQRILQSQITKTNETQFLSFRCVHRNRYSLLKEKHSINKHICNTYNYNYAKLHIIIIHNI